jgi:hypothetical protein
VTLYELAQLLDVEHNFAFCPRDGMTFCNDYAAVFCAARGVRLPPLKANEQKAYLAGSPAWVVIGREEAVTRANAQETVLAVVELQPHGHITPLVESPAEDPTGAYVSAAGARNDVRCRLEKQFGALKPTFFVAVPPQGANHG